MSILVTGAAGYIGSHAVQRLLKDGHEVVGVDNLFRGHAEAIERLRSTAGGSLHFVKADIGERALLEGLMRERRVEAVLHFAAHAYVGESVEQPLLYYRNNAAGALSLIEAAAGAGVQRFVFSSTCATYGEPPAQYIPIPETCPQAPINPYGRSKLHVEHMLFDYAASPAGRDGFAFAALRYFNVAGSDRTGLIGEHHEPETHLIPVILQAALGQRDGVTIFGTDYATPDGTCIRDYIHVEDLIDAHVKVLAALRPGDARTYNLGIGKGYSVRQIIDAARRITQKEFAVKEGPRRPGDPPSLYADPSKIRRDLGWSAQITTLDEVIGSAWRWFQKHPRGYRS
ncbi:MAG: UDP-glucose 4-epimerase GalE [Phycisphaerales bacterium]